MRHSNRIYLANIGVNASHRLVSPLAADGSFTLVTIPESVQVEGLIRYGDVPHLKAVVPEKYWSVATHYDPDFERLTFGDNVGWAPRAAALKGCRPGDWIFFIARLVGQQGPVFALVGGLHLEGTLTEGPRYEANAHVRRARATGVWDGFWVFAGGPASGLFRRALIVRREEAELLFRNRSGERWLWRQDRTVLQTIGSYTRSCRCIIDPAQDGQRASDWWQLLRERVGFAPWR